MTVYAHWTLMKFTITFDPNGGSVTTTSKQVIYTQAIGTLPTPTKNYNNFDGWYTSKEGSSKITETTVMGNADIIVYAHWSLKPTKTCLEKDVPANAQKVGEYWTYTKTETTESTSSSLSGWAQTGSYWKQTGSGSVNYASFPYTFYTGNSIYTSFNKSALSAYENSTSKRTVTNQWAGYVYWHWMYDVCYSKTTTRAISDRKGSFKADGSSGGFYYQYFYAFTSSTNYPYLGTSYCCSRNQASYNCHAAVSWAGDSRNDGVGTPRFFRFDYYTSYYTDYTKTYKYQKVTNNIQSQTAVTAGNGISNVQHYVTYRPI